MVLDMPFFLYCGKAYIKGRKATGEEIKRRKNKETNRGTNKERKE